MMTKFALCAFVSLAVPGFAAADAMMLRLYLADGSSIVSYGEFARVDDRVIFSMVTGGTLEPRLHATSLPASVIDWGRTNLHAMSARHQWYAATRGEDDFQRLSGEVAAVLNTILLTKDRTRALEAAQQARIMLARWPTEHYGYRQHDVREILAVLDESISDLRAAGGTNGFELALVADTPAVPLEPMAVMPSTREQIDQVFRVAALSDRSTERVALLQAGLLLLSEEGSIIPADEAAALRRMAETGIREEQAIDARYGDMARRLMADATRAAARARASDVERVLDRIPPEDTRLGRRRPEIVQALRTSVRAQVDAARHLRLLRDQWAIRRSLYQDYHRSVGAQLLQLVKAGPALEAIRRLEGPTPAALVALQTRLRGGAERLERVQAPADLRSVHELLLSAWRFAESAVNGRYEAARSADVSGAWGASSSAAGALLLLSRAQQELRTLLEPPQLQ